MYKPSLLDKLISYLRYKIIFKNIPKDIDNLLDIGCGPTPWFLKLKNNQDIKIYAIDRLQDIKKLPNIKYFSFEIKDKLFFENDFFDAITILAVLEHLENEKEILSEIFRVLKPGGFLLLTVPTKYAKPILEFLAFKLHLINENSIKEHKRYYIKEYLADLMKNIGFDIKKIFYFEFGFNLFVLAQKPL